MSVLKSLNVLTSALLVLSVSTLTQAATRTFAVEFSDGSTNDAIFYQALTNLGIEAKPRLDLRSAIFDGLSFSCETDNEGQVLGSVNGLDMVSAAWMVGTQERPLITSRGTIGFQDDSSHLVKRQNSASASNDVTHTMSGIDLLREEGYTGEGLFIGVIDTGCDYTHPDLGGCFGPGCKIQAGYDLVGDDYNGYNDPVPDDDPQDALDHGTHVIGTIASNRTPFNTTGVVPDAKIGIWKVFGTNGPVQEDVMIRAYGMAVEAGVDIISVSIGGAGYGWTSGRPQRLVQKIAESGIPVIFAAGNAGTTGLFQASRAADSIGALAVASVNNIVAPRISSMGLAKVTGSNSTLNASAMSFEFVDGNPIFPGVEFGNITAPLYALSLDITVAADGCSALPQSTPDLSPYIVLIKRGTCGLLNKLRNAQTFGAKRVIIYNNIPELLNMPGVGGNKTDLPSMMVRQDIGEAWIKSIQEGSTVEITTFTRASNPPVYKQDPNIGTGGAVSYFSSWGPNYNGRIKPEISAPGAGILSTVPGGYAIYDGTSFAAPFVAGIVGLIKQIRGKDTLTSAQIYSLLESTATPVEYNNETGNSGFLAPIAQQGAGLVNAYKAAHTKTLVDLANIPLNHSASFVPEHPLTITNLSPESQTYAFSHQPAGTVYTFAPGGTIPETSAQPNNLDFELGPSAFATITFSPTTLTIPPNSNGTVLLTFAPPTGLSTPQLPLYSGFVGINSTLGDSLSIPYSGVAANLTTVHQMDTEANYPWLAASPPWTVETATDISAYLPNTTAIPEGRIFTLPANASAGTPDTIYPNILFYLVMGSENVRFYAQPVSSNDTNTNTNATNTTAISPSSLLEIKIDTAPDWRIPGIMARGQEAWVTWKGELFDGTMAEAGMYKLVTRVLRILGDVENEDSWRGYGTVAFELRYL